MRFCIAGAPGKASQTGPHHIPAGCGAGLPGQGVMRIQQTPQEALHKPALDTQCQYTLGHVTARCASSHGAMLSLAAEQQDAECCSAQACSCCLQACQYRATLGCWVSCVQLPADRTDGTEQHWACQTLCKLSCTCMANLTAVRRTTPPSTRLRPGGTSASVQAVQACACTLSAAR